jgi:hypothetical protein
VSGSGALVEGLVYQQSYKPNIFERKLLRRKRLENMFDGMED